ncbi:aminoacyl-tRNA deacylase and HDOD domain-containing protein [Aliikangiella sp. IMCC44359]|uniref:aminoacyl-tRNA deacylase and HDOD domain-containing protein n=1 Tax=Aliikangiella sp. IMCC44359 TaxID=3459125 RepID=UPI00403B2A15
MSIPKSILEQLENDSVEFQVIELPEALDKLNAERLLKEDVNQFVRAVALVEGEAVKVVALPYTSLLDMKVISTLKECEFRVLTLEKQNALFKGCHENTCPPIPNVCSAKMIIDSSVIEMPEIIIESGDPTCLLKLKQNQVKALYKDAETLAFAASQESIYAGREKKASNEDVDVSFTAIRLKQRVDETFDLPAMPEIAQDIMKLRVDPSADATKLAKIVSRDPSLAAQVVSWASSPYYGYQGKVDSVETAIARVLGFELVMNLALGISIGKSLKVPMDGPLGVREFWKQAIYSASLSEKLCRIMPIKQRPERGLIYLSGLLHNFGHLLLGHIFPPQFNLVNTTILANPHIAIEDIEFYVLGVTHEEIGAWLMTNWHMPDELIVAVQRHHQEEFWSKHAVYSNIVLVANRLLKRLGIGDAVDTNLPPSTMDLLSIDEDNAESALRDIELESETLDIMAKQLVA